MGVKHLGAPSIPKGSTIFFMDLVGYTPKKGQAIIVEDPKSFLFFGGFLPIMESLQSKSKKISHN